MKLKIFLAGALIGTIISLIFLDQSFSPQTTETLATPSSKRKAPRPLTALLSDYRSADSGPERYQAAQALGQGSRSNYPQALELAGAHDQTNRLNPESIIILLTWAESDPRAALDWSWKHLGKSRRWEIALEQIMETWIASGDQTVLNFLEQTPQQNDHFTTEEAKEDLPLTLHQDQMSKITDWLYFYDARMARAAWLQGIAPAMRFPMSPSFVDRLSAPEEIKAAYDLWNQDPVKGITLLQLHSRAQTLNITLPGSNSQESVTFTSGNPKNPTVTKPPSKASVQAAMQRQFWKAARTSLPEAITKATALEIIDRQAAYLTIYDSWTLANPGKKPDFTNFPPDALEAWKDLANMGPINDPLTTSSF
ncbi:hypothetical protein V2O64_17320 [Verrucomicrobiaceae bacterium 227]